MEEQVKRILEDLKSKFEIVKQKYFKSSEEFEKLLEMVEKLNVEIGKLKEKQEILKNPKVYKKKINKKLNLINVVFNIIESFLIILLGSISMYGLFTQSNIGVIAKIILICLSGGACLGMVLTDVIDLVKIFKIKRKNKLEIEEIINNNSLEEIEQLLFSKEKQLEEAKGKEKQLSIDIEKYSKTANDLATSHNILLENYEILTAPKEEVIKLEQLTRKRTLNNNFIALQQQLFDLCFIIDDTHSRVRVKNLLPRTLTEEKNYDNIKRIYLKLIYK